ncbi:MAG TPA: ABC transporter permease [Gammaproteobacteria bacterium]|nr:ABC transporter permease [Gammaproteobacteria bacterium]
MDHLDVSSPRARARGRSALVLDGVVRDLRYACRTLFRAPLAAVTIVATVGLGLGLVAAVYTILNAMIFRVDEVRNPHELFVVQRQRSAVAGPETFTHAEYETLLRETKVFAGAFATTGDIHVLIDGVRREGRAVTGNFFGVLGAGTEQGRVLTPSDDEPGSPPVIVLSHRAWVQHFDGDAGVVGRTYRVNGTQFQVIGVTPEGFRGLDVIAAPDFWAPFSTYDVLRERGARGEGSRESADVLSVGLDVVGRLAPGMSRERAEAQLAAWDAQRTTAEERSDRRAVESLVLTPNSGTMPQPAQALLAFAPLFFAFGLILFIGCANVANLLLARLVARQRELGVRLALGASRRRVVWQLLIESLLLALLAAVLAFGLARAVLKSIEYVLVTSFPPELGSLRVAVPPGDWRVAVFLLFAAMASTVLFALAPALRATRSEVTRAINGQLLTGARPGRKRNVLVTLQVTASVLLLICAAIFLRGTLAASTRDPGVRTADIVNVAVLDEQKRGAILESVRNDPSVAAVAAAWPAFLGGLTGVGAYGEGASGKSVLRYALVSPEFFGVFDLDILRGRGFAPAERGPNEAVAVVSETVARELWPGGDALGQTLRLTPDPSIGRPASAPPLPPQTFDDPMMQPRTAVVVGVTRDVAGFSVGGMKLGGAGVYLPVSADAAATGLIVRTRGDAERVRNALVDRLAAVDPNMTEVSTLATLASTDAYLLGMEFWLTFVLGSLALLLTLSGLFSVLSYLVEQRTREIGVRMALGATSRGVGALVLRQCARPVGLGVLIGSTLTIGVSAALLASPAAEQIAGTVRLLDPVAYAGSLLLIVGACAGAALVPALRAGKVNPLAALRQD